MDLITSRYLKSGSIPTSKLKLLNQLPLTEFKTLDTGMGLPEGVRRVRIRDSEIVKDESIEIWDNTVEKSARTGGINNFI